MSIVAALAAILLSAGEDELPRTLLDDLPVERVEPVLEMLDLKRDDDPETPHGSFSGFFNLHGSSHAWKETVWDQYLTQPAVLLPVGLGVAAIAVLPFDRRLERHWQGVIQGKQNLGNIGVYSLIGISALTGVLFPGEGRNGWDESWTVAESFLCSYVTVSVLKSTVHRLRPGHGTHSFPSGHSAMAFTAATLIERNLGPYAGIPAYALAAFVAFERVESGRHFPSDVFAGAAIGVLSASIVDALHWGGRPDDGGISTRSFALGVDVPGPHALEVHLEIRF